MTPFIIYALPRSRTAWLSCFLSYGPWRVAHELPTIAETISGVTRYFGQKYVGAVDTGAIVGADSIRKLVPDIREAVVFRDYQDSAASLRRMGFSGDIEQSLSAQELKLLDLACRADVLAIKFGDLDNEATCKGLFEYCLQMPFDREWWLRWRALNIQIDAKKLIASIPGTLARSNLGGLSVLYQRT